MHADIEIPDSALARAATDLVRKAASPLLFDHSRRVFLFGSLAGVRRRLAYDPELLYVGAMFHDLGLTETYRTPASASRSTARTRRVASSMSTACRRTASASCGRRSPCTPRRRFRTTWPRRSLWSPPASRPTSWASPWTRSRRRPVRRSSRPTPAPTSSVAFWRAFTEGNAYRPETTFGNVNADVLERFVPGFVRPNFVEIIENSAWPE